MLLQNRDETTALASIRSAHSPSFSPDGMRIAYVSDASGIPQVWIASLDGSNPVQITNLTDPVQSVRWSPAGKWLAYDVAPDGGLNVQIYVVHPDGTGTKCLTSGGKTNNGLGGWGQNTAGWSKDGTWLAIKTNKDHPERMDAFLVNPDTQEMKPVGKSESISSVIDISKDGKWATLHRLEMRGNDNIFLANIESKQETLLTPHREHSVFGSGFFSPDGRKVYLTANDVTDMASFGSVELSEQHRPSPIRILLSREDAEADDLALDREGRHAVLLWNASGKSEIAFLDITSGKVSGGPELPGEIARELTFNPDGSKVALTISGAAIPTDIWVIDVTSGKLSQVTHSAHAGVDLAKLVRPQLITYKAHDGLQLSGWLYRAPNAKGPGPVVFFYHGGPEGQSRPYLEGGTQALLARGISVFFPNVRGSSGFGKRFINLDNGPLRVNGVKDIEASTNALVSMGIADPKRLGIMGGSYGGYMTMAGITEFPDMFAAAVNLFGVVNFDTFFKYTEPWMAAVSKVKFGDPDTQAEMLRQLSPINKIDLVKTPLMVLHGAHDTNVPVIEAEQIVENLRKRGVGVEYVLYPDEGHGWQKVSNRIDSTVKIADFFERHLRGA